MAVGRAGKPGQRARTRLAFSGLRAHGSSPRRACHAPISLSLSLSLSEQGPEREHGGPGEWRFPRSRSQPRAVPCMSVLRRPTVMAEGADGRRRALQRRRRRERRCNRDARRLSSFPLTNFIASPSSSRGRCHRIHSLSPPRETSRPSPSPRRRPSFPVVKPPALPTAAFSLARRRRPPHVVCPSRWLSLRQTGPELLSLSPSNGHPLSHTRTLLPSSPSPSACPPCQASSYLPAPRPRLDSGRPPALAPVRPRPLGVLRQAAATSSALAHSTRRGEESGPGQPSQQRPRATMGWTLLVLLREEASRGRGGVGRRARLR